MPVKNDSDTEFQEADDNEQLQTVVLHAAIQGDQAVRNQLPQLLDVFEEPYRSVAARLRSHFTDGGFVDRHTLPSILRNTRLARRTATGSLEELTPQGLTSLVCQTEVQPGQAAAYVQMLLSRRREKQALDFQDRVVELAKTHGGNPLQLRDRVDGLLAEAARHGLLAEKDTHTELLELIPYMQELVSRQRGVEYLGLDSGFNHLNNLTNGLDTGLNILAAPPGKGKTTLAFQVACQAAEKNQVPVIFVSLEQSKQELRAKAFARLSGLEYRHILRGRLRADDPSHVEKLQQAADAYVPISQYLTIVEGDDQTTVSRIRQLAAAKLSAARVKRCFVVVDYLQIVPLDLECSQHYQNTKDRVDYLVSSLRRMARSLDSPVWAISAENRSGYGKKTLDVFKESGGIEYSADTAMILSKDEHAPSDKVDYVPLRVNIIKNRNGERGVVTFKFFPKTARFVEGTKESLADDSAE